ncbi:MAG: M16 family metallopeptidase [Myxococcota bacterium]
MLNADIRTLSNGLRVVLLDVPHVHSASCALMVRSGPRYERPEENGIAHLVEHLLFRGTRSHPSSFDFHVAVESLGGEINGLTQRDATTIHITVPPQHLEAGLSLLGEVSTEPLLTGLAVERDVVVEEILDSLDAEGHDLDLDSISRRILWGDHPMAFPVAGDLELVESLTEAECRAFHRRFYTARNSVLVVAGPLEPNRVHQWAQQAFSRMTEGAEIPDPPAPKPRSRLPIHVQPTDDAQVSALLTFPAPHENHDDFGRLMVLRRILDDGFASRLRQAICEQRGLAYSLSVGVDAYRDAGAFDIEVACTPKKLFGAIEQMLDTLEGLKADPVQTDELERAKTRHLADLQFALDDPNELCGWYGASALMNVQKSAEAQQKEILEVRPDDLLHFANRLFRREDALLTLVGPVDERSTYRLERLLNRPAESTVWLGQDLEGEDEVMLENAEGPRLIAG